MSQDSGAGLFRRAMDVVYWTGAVIACIALVVVSAILIVYGRVYHRSRWGDWIAVAGFAVLVLAGVLALLSGR